MGGVGPHIAIYDRGNGDLNRQEKHIKNNAMH